MRKLTFLVLLVGFCSCIKTSSNSACSQNITTSNCIDMSGVDTTAFCTEQYEPVCGCNEVTYGNSCEATQAGVQSWIEGECCP